VQGPKEQSTTSTEASDCGDAYFSSMDMQFITILELLLDVGQSIWKA
jgi:hypothetical protein